MNTRVIYFKDGKHLTIGEEEFYAVKKEILSGKKFIHVQNNLISVNTISRVGSHEGAAEMIRREKGNRQVGLPYDQKLLSTVERKENSIIGSENKSDSKLYHDDIKNDSRHGFGGVAMFAESIESRGMTSEEDERGDSMFWVDDKGIKHYD